MGGLPKKAYQLEKIRKETAEPILALDAGAVLFKQDNFSPVLLEQGKATAAAIVKGYNLMHYDAAGIAPQDLVAGLSFLKKMAKQSDFPWLSANLVDEKTGKPIFPASIIKKVGSITVGIIGITGQEANAQLKPEDGARIGDWQEKLPTLAADLDKQCDLLILLSSQPLSENQKIAATVPEIHLIFQSGTLTANLEPQKIGNSLVLQTEKQGKHIGLLQINWYESGTWYDDKSKILAQQKNTMDRLNWRINRFRRQGDPEKLYQDNPEKLKIYQELIDQQKELQKEINALEATIEQETRQGIAASTYSNKFYAMETELPDQPKIQRLVAETTEEVNKIGMQSTTALTAGQKSSLATYPENFVGAVMCANCHPQQDTTWKATRHAKAYQTLVAENKQFNLNCIPCHVTGVVTGEEPQALSLPADMQKVGCEACHGAGRLHIQFPEQWPLPKRPAEEVCRRCHTPEQDDSFDYLTDIERLGCFLPTAH